MGATKEAISAALDAAKDVGGEAVEAVKKALETGVEGAKDIIEAAKEE